MRDHHVYLVRVLFNLMDYVHCTIINLHPSYKYSKTVNKGKKPRVRRRYISHKTAEQWKDIILFWVKLLYVCCKFFIRIVRYKRVLLFSLFLFVRRTM